MSPKGRAPQKTRITAMQRAFVSAIVCGKGPSDAYREAYPGTRMSDANIATQAQRLLGHPKLGPMIERGQQRAAEKAGLTLEVHLEALRLIRDKAMRANDFATGMRCEELRGKAVGMYAEPRGRTDLASIMRRFAAMTDEELHAEARGLKLVNGE